MLRWVFGWVKGVHVFRWPGWVKGVHGFRLVKGVDVYSMCIINACMCLSDGEMVSLCLDR